MKRTFFLMHLLVFYLAATPVFSVEAADTRQLQQAPLNPEFLSFQKERQAEGASVLPGPSLGYIPPPFDRSHLKGAPAQLRTLSLPASFDLRTTGRLTPVRDQGGCGSCWAFAAIGSIESGLMPDEPRDFSENHLKNTHGFDWSPCYGGNDDIAAAYLMRWGGPVDEADDPYRTDNDISVSGLPVQKHVQKVVFLPPRISSLDNDRIKAAVMTDGAIVANMMFDSSYYNFITNAYYFSGTGSTNHAVAIVGWDDNFPASSFLNPPPGNGAFIIRNSWGAGFGDNGYFYISYYDSKLGTSLTSLSRPEQVGNFANMYSHDPFGMISAIGWGLETSFFANVFTPLGDESVTAVSFFNAGNNSSYAVEVYGNLADPTNPRAGRLLSSKSGILADSGYGTIRLDTPAPVSAGQKFSIIVRLTTPGYLYSTPLEHAVAGYSSSAAAEPGQSFISSDGTNWQDLAQQIPTANVCLKAYTVPGPDTAPPQITAFEVPEGFQPMTVPIIALTATDNVGITGYLVNESRVRPLPSDPGWSATPPSSYTVSSTGVHDLYAWAKDAAGNVSENLTVRVEIPDRTPPTVTEFVIPAVSNSLIVPITALTASDDGQITGYLITEDPEQNDPPYPQSGYSTNPTRYIFSTPGVKTLYAFAKDRYGNISTPRAATITITAPVAVELVEYRRRIQGEDSNLGNSAYVELMNFAPGALVVVAVSGWPNPPAANAVTDMFGNTYKRAGEVLFAEGAYSAVYYATVVKGGTDGYVSFQAAGEDSGEFVPQITMTAAIFVGIDPMAPLDRVAEATGFGRFPSSGAIAGNVSGSLLIGTGTHNCTTTTTPGAGFQMIASQENANGTQPFAMAYRVLPGTQPTEATFSMESGCSWTQHGVLFKPLSTDTAPPTVAISAPVAGSTVSGMVEVIAGTTDDTGVATVAFSVDGKVLATLTAPPYGYLWDTNSHANGTHSLTARSCDAAANCTTSAAVNVTVSNKSGGIALVQKGSSTSSSARTLTVTLPAPVAPGNLVVVAVAGYPNLPSSPAVTDNLGNSYARAGSVKNVAGAYSALYYAKNVKGGNATLTFRTVAAGGQLSMAVAEFSGVATVSPLDKTAGRTGSGTTPTTGAMYPAVPGELLIGAGTHNGTTTTTAGAGFSMVAPPVEDSESHQPLAFEYRVLTGATATAATFRLNNGFSWAQSGALFRPR